MKKTLLCAAIAALCLQAQAENAAFEETFTTGDFTSAGTYATITLSDAQMLDLTGSWTMEITSTVNPSSPTTNYWVKDVLVTGTHGATDNYTGADGGFRFFVATINHQNITPGTLVYAIGGTETQTNIIVEDDTPLTITLAHEDGATDTAVTVTYAGSTENLTFSNLSSSFSTFSSNVPVSSGTIQVSISAPEPATATLSLLALAGLAARRRRH